MIDTKELLAKLSNGGMIVSSNDCDEMTIAFAQAEYRMYVDDNGYGYIYFPKVVDKQAINEIDALRAQLEDRNNAIAILQDIIEENKKQLALLEGATVVEVGDDYESGCPFYDYSSNDCNIAPVRCKELTTCNKPENCPLRKGSVIVKMKEAKK